ncbi:MAG: hypothetical protein IJD13_02640, partial [Oscillospiraceae bacterium]|nr:hypothetical protein [Oscillospiraceae bacterium]
MKWFQKKKHEENVSFEAADEIVNKTRDISEEEAAHIEQDIAAEVDAVMKKYDRESNTRIWEGTPKIVITCILALFALFCMYVTLFARWL